MGVVEYNQKTGSIEVTYGGRENPFTGIDSSAPNPYISPASQTTDSSNSLVIDNSIRAINFIKESNYTSNSTTIVIGIGDLLGVVFSVKYDTNTKMISVYTYPNFPSGPENLVGSVSIPNYSSVSPTPTPKYNSLTFKNINGVCFFSFEGCPYILQHNNVSLSILTNYLGASFLNELNGRLIALDVFKFTSKGTPTQSSQTSTITITGTNYNTVLTYNATQYEYSSAFRTTGSVTGGTLTDYIVVHNFAGISVPAGAIIKGMQVSVDWSADVANGTGIIENVSLYSSGASIGTVKTPGTSNFTTPTTNSYGAADDLWGAALTSAIVNDPTFGFGIQVKAIDVGSTRSFFFTLSITITYLNPTNISVAGTSEATLTQNGIGSSTNTGSVITFPNIPIVAGNTISVVFGISATASWFLGSGNIKAQYFVDGGTNWIDCFDVGTTGTSGSQNYSFPESAITIPATGLTNLNQISMRAVAIATVTGDSGNSTVDNTLDNIQVTLGSDAQPGAITEYPYQIAWSAPTQQYGQFNPLDANNLVTGAGYNNLPDVEDVITGYFNIGPTGYILRNQGITEVSPLNSGINPFDFNHLWASHKGIGTIYSNSVAQYGSIGAFFSDTGIYTIGYEGISIIDNKAKSAIYKELILINNANLLYAGIGPLQIDGENFLAYIIAAQNPTTGVITLYLFNFNSKEWFRFTVAEANTNLSLALVAINGLITTNYLNTLFLITNEIAGSFESWHLPVNSGIVAGNSAEIDLPIEEIKIYRDITIDAIIVFYNVKDPTGTCTGTLTINGVSFTLMNSTSCVFDGTWRYVILYPTAQLFTGISPQLKINLSTTSGTAIPFYIGKVVEFGSLDATQRPA